MGAVVEDDGQSDALETGEPLGVPVGGPAPGGDQVGEPPELDAHDRGLHVGHPVVEAGLLEGRHGQRGLSLPRERGGDAVGVERAGPVHQRGVVADQRAALAAGDALAAVEAEGGQVGEAARRATAVDGARGAGGVLDQPEPVPVGDRAQVVVVGGLADQVDRDDADGARRDQGLHAGRVDGADVGPDVGEHGGGTRPDHGVAGRGERVVGDHDLVARSHAEDLQGQVEGRAAVGGGQRVGRPRPRPRSPARRPRRSGRRRRASRTRTRRARRRARPRPRSAGPGRRTVGGGGGTPSAPQKSRSRPTR